MKTNRNVLKAIAAALLTATAGLAGAQTTTQELDVSATVLGICKFGSPPWAAAAIALTFDDIDPSGTTDATKNVLVPYRCTNGLTATLSTSSLNSWSLKNGTDSITYSLDAITVNAGGGFSAAGAKNLSVTARITPTNYQDAKALIYTDTVTLTLTF